ncbi:MAG: phospholipid/cholesterol/gamma-HCH transport system substrate-binding protein [Mycobacterium sp.]|jgi:virulence factor Mce-like protein|nr:phospholipid/cholesterol/gamma-HCH transport system substrate-binding protein [Mycobacterium sp.]
MIERTLTRLITVACCVVGVATGCAFHGLNSLPLPGTLGDGPGAQIYHAEFANIGTLESNSPVMIDDVVVGSVRKMTFSDWHIDVDLSVEADVVVPANAAATIGQTSLLGSLHVALDPPVGQSPSGRLAPGATLPLQESVTYPTTEQTLSSLSAVVNGGGLGQIGNIIGNFNAALSGRQDDVRDVLTRLDKFVGVLDAQRAEVIASIQALNRLAGTFAGQRDVISEALLKIPPALDVLIAERPRITAALDKLRILSGTSTRLVDDSQADLVTNLRNLDPTIRALADVGDGLDQALATATVFPLGQNVIDRGARGDFMNLFAIIDLTIPRLKRSLMLGTRWGEPGAALVPAPGEPYYLRYTYDPLMTPITGAATVPTAPGGAPQPVDGAPPLPQSAPLTPGEAAPVLPRGPSPPIFAGPYGAPGAPAGAQPAAPAGGG